MNPIPIADFINIALKRILVQGDKPAPITPSEQNDALYTLNEIIDSWNADGKNIYSMQYLTFALTPGQQTYTIGPSNTANFNTGTSPRPSFLEFASFQQISSTPVIDLPMKIVDADEWAAIVTKKVSTDIGFYVYMDEQWPLANLNIWPIPSQSANIVLASWNFLDSERWPG